MVDGNVSKDNTPFRDPRWENPTKAPKLDPRWGRPLNESTVQNERLLKPYQVRPLTPEENTRIEKAAIDQNQFELTRTLLSKDELKPTNVLTIGEAEFMVGKVINFGFLVMFYNEPQTKQLVPRVIVGSESGRSWMATPGFGGDGYSGYNKGKIHYTQAIKPHINIIRYIDQAIDNNYIAFRRGENIVEEYFDLGGRSGPKPAWYTLNKETSRYDDKGALKEFQKYRAGHLTTSSIGKNVSLSQEFRNFDFSTPQLKGFVPDFTKAPIETQVLKHASYGEVKLEAYPAQLNGRPIEWVIAHDRIGRVWIERITFLDREVNSYGIMPEVIDSGALTSKPFDYLNQATALKEGEECISYEVGNGKADTDMTPLLDNLTPIQLFRRARGIKVDQESRRKFWKMRFENVKNFEDLQIVLDREAGFILRDSSRRRYSPGDLSSLVARAIQTKDLNILPDEQNRKPGYHYPVDDLRKAVKSIINPRN